MYLGLSNCKNRNSWGRDRDRYLAILFHIPTPTNKPLVSSIKQNKMLDEDDMSSSPTSLLAEIMKMHANGGGGGSGGQRKKGTANKKTTKRTPAVTATNGTGSAESPSAAFMKSLGKVQGGNVTFRYRLRPLLSHIVNALKSNGKSVEFSFTPTGVTTEPVQQQDQDMINYQVYTTANMNSQWFDFYECTGTVHAVIHLGTLSTILTQYKSWQMSYIQVDADNDRMVIRGIQENGDVRSEINMGYTQDAKKRHVDNYLPLSQYPYSIRCYSAALLSYISGYAQIIQVPASESCMFALRLYPDSRRLFLRVVSRTSLVRQITTELTAATDVQPGKLLAKAALKTALVPKKPRKRKAEKAASSTKISKKKQALAAAAAAAATTTTDATAPSPEILAPDTTTEPLVAEVIDMAMEAARATLPISAGMIARRGGGRGGGRRRGRIATTNKGVTVAADQGVVVTMGEQGVVVMTGEQVVMPAAAAVKEEKEEKEEKQLEEPVATTEEPATPAAPVVVPILPIAPVIMDDAKNRDETSGLFQDDIGKYVEVIVDQRDLLVAMANPKMDTCCSLHFMDGQPLSIRFVVKKAMEGNSPDAHSITTTGGGGDGMATTVVDIYVVQKNVKASDVLSGSSMD